MNKEANKDSRTTDQAWETKQGVEYVSRLFLKDTNMTSFLESLAEGLIVIDKNETILLVNKRMEEMSGYERDEVVGQPLGMLMPHRFATNHSNHVSDYFDQPRIRSMGQGLGLAARNKDGTEFPIDISLSFMPTEKGMLSLALVTDITKLKKAEEALIQRNDDLDSFAHTLAHELKGSLSVITGFSEALMEMGESFSEEEKNDYLNRIMNNGYKANDIINELLRFADMRREEVELNPLKMSEIVKEGLKQLHDQIEKSGAKIALPTSYPDVMGYGPWIEEVWVNYISNALKYGGPSPRIELGSTVIDDNFIKFWVKDSGKGLTAQQQSQLFVAHKRLNHPQIEGSGLGLSIVKRITEKLGGQVGVESKVGKGSIFSFTLPCKR
ncbi:MAG: PAS domain S-box protein [Proteobacteria bacterium]|nr:PAS domain S-box protein [Pseudomonadota bacterium]